MLLVGPSLPYQPGCSRGSTIWRRVETSEELLAGTRLAQGDIPAGTDDVTGWGRFRS